MTRLRIGGGEPVELRVEGFISARAAHGHLFKHVFRLAGLSYRELQANDDPERWAELLPELDHDLSRRRDLALRRLAEAGGCRLCEKAPTEDVVCAECPDERALGRIGHLFGEVLDGYRRSAASAIHWCVENPSRHGLRLLAYRHDDHVRIKALDSRRCVAVGVLEQDGQVRLLSCYRREPGAPSRRAGST